MPILTSTILSSHPQQDGRAYITERHTDHNGKTYEHEYLADAGLDVDLVMQLRAQSLGATIDAREAAEAEAANYTIPLTKLQFRNRFTAQEKVAIDAFNAGYEAHPGLSDEQKAVIRSSLEDYRMAENIRLSDPATIAGVMMYEALGLIAPGRAAEVLNDG